MSRPSNYEILHYLTLNGREPYAEWLVDLDRSVAGRIEACVTRMKRGNFGATRCVGENVLELKIDFGPGYRVYYLRDGERIVVLLCAGDKGSQFNDISDARKYASDYWRRK